MPRELVRKISTPAGVIFPFSGSTAPDGFFICDGRAISRTVYATLFATIGTTYGAGNGIDTFNIPDYRGQFLRGQILSSLNSITGSGTVSSNNATFTNHGINRNGFKVRLTSGTLTGLASSTDYFAIVIDSNTLAFASSQLNAVNGVKLPISGANSAVIRQFEDPDISTRVSGSSGLGSFQPDETRGHTHGAGTFATGNLVVDISATSGAGYTLVDQYENGTADSLYERITTSSITGSSASSGGNENRPTNVYVNYIIKF